jgi:hypothetical protein
LLALAVIVDLALGFCRELANTDRVALLPVILRDAHAAAAAVVLAILVLVTLDVAVLENADQVTLALGIECAAPADLEGA